MITPIQTGASFREQRRTRISRHPTQIGLDYVEVQKVQVEEGEMETWKLLLYFVPKASVGKGEAKVIPDDLQPDKIRITTSEGVTTPGIRVRRVLQKKEGENVLGIEVNVEASAAGGTGDASLYTLELVKVMDLDPFFAQASFSFRVDEPSRFDVWAPLQAVPETGPGPEINYLAKDYQSFRQLMLDRLSLVMPQWRENNPADLGHVLVEVLAYAADHLSYYQDAVATEAYLGTARKRVSIRRHARLLDYAMHEGCNARAWVHIEVESEADKVELREYTPLLTKVAGQPACISLGSDIYDRAMAGKPEVFETLHPTKIVPAHNRIPLYAWGAGDLILPAGATAATLRDEWIENDQRKLHLKPGDVLIFEEVESPEPGGDPNPAHRHAVRLTKVTASKDPLEGQPESKPIPLVEVAWDAEDALPFDLCVTAVRDGESLEISVARGNIVLVDHGRTIEDEELLPPAVPESERYHPRLQRNNVTYRVPYRDDSARKQSAAETLLQDPHKAWPFVTLKGAPTNPGVPGEEKEQPWMAQRDLLSSDRFARDFVLETESDGQAYLRFGNGVRGRQPAPGSCLKATYRIGNGLAGNVGPEAIGHVVVRDLEKIKHICKVRNPLPARGGIDPEPLEKVRRDAPAVVYNQERAVKAEDYASMACRHPEVKRAAATLRWTGSWPAVLVSIERVDRRPVDRTFREEMLEFLERFRLAGCDLEIRSPQWVPLDIALSVHVLPEHYRSTVQRAMLETFSNVDLPDGRRGFFHPDRFGFGEPVYQSQVVAKAVSVPGVAWVKATRFRRWGWPGKGGLESGEILIGPLEIVRLDNTPDRPENGTLEFKLQGGQ